MIPTDASLLGRLRTARPDPADWRRLHDLYAPLVRRWVARDPSLAADTDDLVQEVLAVVVRELPGFDRQRDGAFRAWLRRVVVNRVRTWRRSAGRQPRAADPTEPFLAQLADPASGLSRQWDREHDRHVADTLMAAVERDFTPPTWQAFRLFALDGWPAAEVAARTGLSENAVLLAKSRVLKRLREEAAGLLD